MGIKKKRGKNKRSGGEREQPEMPSGKRMECSIWDLAQPLCQAEGIELVAVELKSEGRGKTLRLLLDKPGGVVLDDCANISRQVNDLLDIYLDHIGPYALEVSSPGPRRPLTKVEDYERFKGDRVRIKTATCIEGKRIFKGILMGIADDRVSLEVAHKTISIPLVTILHAQLMP